MSTICLVILLALVFSETNASSTHGENEKWNSTTRNDQLLTNVIEPLEYHLELFLKPQDYTIGGMANILIRIYKPTQIITLHAYQMKIEIRESVITWNKELDNITKYAMPKQINFILEPQLVVIEFFQILSPGLFNLKLSFSTPIANNTGFVRYAYTTNEGDTKWIITTLNKPFAARKVFPCWDQPDVRLSYKISIKHRVEDEVLSNMPKERILPADENGMQSTYFDRTPPIPVHQVAIAVIHMNISKIQFNVKNITWYVLELENLTKSLSFVQLKMNEFKDSLDSYTKVRNIMPKTDYIVMSEFPMNIIESPGLVIFRERDIKYVENQDFPGTELKLLRFVGRHMATQLFDGIVNTFQWGKSWLNEALAVYLSYYISSEIRQDPSIMDLFIVQILQPALHNEVTFNMKPISHKVDYTDEIETFLYSHLYYEKGSAFIHMLQEVVNRKYFRKAVRDYLSLFKQQTVTNDAFWTILQNIFYNATLRSDFTIMPIIYTWLAHRSCLVFNVKRQYGENNALIKSNCNITYNENLYIPTTYTSQSNLYDYNIQWIKHNKPNVLVGLDTNEFVLLNVNQTGYYRVNYDRKNWQKIASYLNYKNYALIPTLNRAQIIDDAYYFMKIGHLDFHLFINIIRYLRRETNYIAWYPMFNILSTWSIFFQYQRSDFIKSNILEILESLLNKIGYEEYLQENDMRKSLRLLATKWACKLGHIECRKAATAKLVTRLTDLKNRTEILPWWKDWIYCTGMMHLNEGLFLHTAYLSIYNRDMETLEYLTCSENEVLLTQYMDLFRDVYNNKEFMDSKMIAKLYHLIIKKHARKDQVLQFIFTNYDFIETIFFPSLHIEELWSNIIMNIYSKASRLQIKRFTENHSRISETSKTLIQQLLDAKLKEADKVRFMFNF